MDTLEINLNENNNYQVFLENTNTISFDKKVAIISNPKVYGLHLEYLLKKLDIKEYILISIKDGEEHKNMQTVEYILENLFIHNFDRKSLLIAFGGGVIGDITGFCAAIFQRGIDFIQIPTTLLAQIDSSIGGKVGVNNKFGKNLIGCFYQPKAVYIYTHFLSSLKERVFNAGLAEIIKIALIFDKEFFSYIKEANLNDKEELLYIVKKSLELKAMVVKKDEKEKGLRAVLNYGHTFGHIIEKLSSYNKYLHGEAVSIGMIMANELAFKKGFLSLKEKELIKETLNKYHLNIKYKIKDISEFYNSFYLDKKTSNSKIKFILLNGIGNYIVKDSIEKEEVLEVLGNFT